MTFQTISIDEAHLLTIYRRQTPAWREAFLARIVQSLEPSEPDTHSPERAGVPKNIRLTRREHVPA